MKCWSFWLLILQLYLSAARIPSSNTESLPACYINDIVAGADNSEFISILQFNSRRHHSSKTKAILHKNTTSFSSWSRPLSSQELQNIRRVGWFVILAYVLACILFMVLGILKKQCHLALTSTLWLSMTLVTAGLTITIPTSYDLAVELGHSETFSGLFIAAPFALYPIGAIFARHVVLPWHEKTAQKMVIFGFCAFGLITAASAVIIDPPYVKPSNALRSSLLLLTRASYGLFRSCGDVLELVAIKRTPEAAMEFLTVGISASFSVGDGAGPLISSLMIELSGLTDPAKQAGLTMVLTSVLLLFMVIVIVSLFRYIGSEQKEETPPEEVSSIGFPSELLSLSVQDRRGTTGKKHLIYILTILHGGLVSLVFSSLESGISLIMEQEIGMDADDIGIVVGTAFCVSALVTMVRSCLFQADVDEGKLNGTQLLAIPLITIPAFTSLLLFRQIPAFLGLNGIHVYLLLAVIIVIVSTFGMSDGISQSMGYKVSEAGTFYSQENIAIFSAVLYDGVGNFLGPPLARMAIEIGGSCYFAVVQVMLSVLSFLILLNMRRAAVWIDAQHQPEQSREVKMVS
jgi:hypothetical protein